MGMLEYLKQKVSFSELLIPGGSCRFGTLMVGVSMLDDARLLSCTSNKLTIPFYKCWMIRHDVVSCASWYVTQELSISKIVFPVMWNKNQQSSEFIYILDLLVYFHYIIHFVHNDKFASLSPCCKAVFTNFIITCSIMPTHFVFFRHSKKCSRTLDTFQETWNEWLGWNNTILELLLDGLQEFPINPIYYGKSYKKGRRKSSLNDRTRWQYHLNI